MSVRKNKTDALKRENLLKQKSRSFIEKLIAGSEIPIYNRENAVRIRSENRNKLMRPTCKLRFQFSTKKNLFC